MVLSVAWRRRSRHDAVWGLAFVLCLAAWLGIAAWVAASVNVDGSFKPTGTLANQIKECHLVRGFGREASTVVGKLAGKAHMWTIFLDHIEIPTGALGLVLLLSCLWLVALQHCGYVAVWATMLIKSTALILLGFRFQHYGFDSAAQSCLIVGVGMAILTLWQYKRINLTAKLMQKVGTSLQENGCSLWVAAGALQILFILCFLIFAYIGAGAFYVWELRRTESGSCVLERSVASRNLQAASAFLFAWATSFLRSARLLVVAAPTVCWYYPGIADAAPENPSFAALGWTMTSSLGTVSVAGLIAAIAAKAEEAATTRRRSGMMTGCCRCECLNPISLIFQLVWYLMESCAVTATRFALLAHLFTAKGFWESGLTAYRTMEARGVVGGYIVAQAGESVVTMGAYVFSAVVGLIAWEYVDAVYGYKTLSDYGSTVSSEILFYFLFAMYLLLTYYPTVTLMILVLASDYLPNWSTPFLSGLFLACATHLFMGFLGEVILAATQTLYFCVCLDSRERRRRGVTGMPVAKADERKLIETSVGGSMNEPTAPPAGDREQMELQKLFLHLEETSGPVVPSAPPLEAPSVSDDEDDEKWTGAWGMVVTDENQEADEPYRRDMENVPGDLPAGQTQTSHLLEGDRMRGSRQSGYNSFEK